VDEDLLESTDPEEPDGFLPAVRAVPGLAIAALVLATCSLLGVGLLSGSTYVAVEAANGRDFTGSKLVPATLLGAVIAGLIALLAYRIWHLAGRGGTPWIPAVALAAMVVSGASFAARLVVAVLELSGQASYATFGRF
jgi:hypothetical protein